MFFNQLFLDFIRTAEQLYYILQNRTNIKDINDIYEELNLSFEEKMDRYYEMINEGLDKRLAALIAEAGMYIPCKNKKITIETTSPPYKKLIFNVELTMYCQSRMYSSIVTVPFVIKKSTDDREVDPPSNKFVVEKTTDDLEVRVLTGNGSRIGICGYNNRDVASAIISVAEILYNINVLKL